MYNFLLESHVRFTCLLGFALYTVESLLLKALNICLRFNQSEKHRKSLLCGIVMMCHGLLKIGVCVPSGCCKLEGSKTRSLNNLVCIGTLSSLYRRYQHTGSTRDYPRPGAPLVKSRLQDNHIRLTHLRNRFQSASLTARTIPGHQIINPRTVRNRLRAVNIRPRRPAIRPVLTRRHRVARLGWCRIRLRFTRRLWAEILFTDESRFSLDS